MKNYLVVSLLSLLFTGAFAFASVNEAVVTSQVSSAKPNIHLDANNIVHIAFTYFDKYKISEMLTNATRSELGWDLETIDTKTKSNDWHPSYALDSNNNPYYLYVDSKYYDLTYAHPLQTVLTKEILQLPDDFYIGPDTSITHDNNDWPHILYYNLATGQLRYAHQPFINHWVSESLGSLAMTSWSASIACDPDGVVHVVFFDNKLWGIQHLWNVSGTWKRETIAKPGEVDSTSLAISPDGNLHVAYHVINTNTVWYGTKISTWDLQEIGAGKQPELNLVNGYTPQIAYLATTAKELSEVTLTSSGNWKKKTILPAIDDIQQFSATIDQHQNTLYVYSKKSSGLYFLSDALPAPQTATAFPTATVLDNNEVATVTPTATSNQQMVASETPSPTSSSSLLTATPLATSVSGTYQAEWMWQTQSQDPSGNFLVKPGDTVTVNVAFKNTGTVPWQATGDDEVSIAVYKDTAVSSGPPRSCFSNPVATCAGTGKFGESYFYSSSWRSLYRLGVIAENQVLPGAVGTFTMTFSIPSNAVPGTYREDITVAHGPHWMKNTVNGDKLGMAHIWVGFTVTNTNIFRESFTASESLNLFQIIDTGDTFTPSQWVVKDGRLQQRSNIWGGTFGKPEGGFSFLGSTATLKDKQYKNFNASFTAKTLDDDGIGFIFRSDGSNYYRLLIVKDSKNGGPFTLLDKRTKEVSNGKTTYKYTPIATSPWAYEQGKEFGVAVQAIDSSIKILINNTELISVTNDSLTEGTLGLYSYGSEGVWFDDLVVESL